MQLDEGDFQFTPEQRVLIERARQAVKSVNHSIYQRFSWGAIDHVVTALVYNDPLRIDFKAHTPGKIGQAFIGPMLPLTEDLFEGESFKREIWDNVKAGVEAYREHLRSDD